MFHRSQNSWPTGLKHTTCCPGPDKIALAWLLMPRDLAEFKASRDNNKTQRESESADTALKMDGLGIKKTGLVKILFLMNKSNTKLQECSMSNYWQKQQKIAEFCSRARCIPEPKHEHSSQDQ
ncbi:hypothetical protein Peur_014757 [Populus x canadensis]